MNEPSMRFAVTAMRKASKSALFKCKRLIVTSKEADRLEGELDKLARQVKHDMAVAKVPKVLAKDRRMSALEDVSKTLERLNKKLKISVFMENYLSEERDRRKQKMESLKQQIEDANKESAEAGAADVGLAPSMFEQATRANRACPPEFARPRSTVAQDPRLRTAAGSFLYYSRYLSEAG
jgi:hypothetical protein